METGVTIVIKPTRITVTVGVFLGFLLFGFYYAWCKQGLDSQESAGWMQAFGSVAAIVAAVGMLYFQESKAREKERNEIISFLRGVQVEIRNYAANEVPPVQKQLLESISGTKFEIRSPIVSHPYPIFSNLHLYFPKIDDLGFRSRLLHVYNEIRLYEDAVQLLSDTMRESRRRIEFFVCNKEACSKSNNFSYFEEEVATSQNDVVGISDQLRKNLPIVREKAHKLNSEIEDFISTGK